MVADPNQDNISSIVNLENEFTSNFGWLEINRMRIGNAFQRLNVVFIWNRLRVFKE